MKNTENIKAPEAFLIERGGQQTDHKAAHSRHSDGASKRTQGEPQPAGASPTSTTPGEAGGSQKGGWELSFTGRTSLQGDRWEAVQTESFLLTPSPKESLSRCGDFGILERDLQKHGLRTAIELSELTSSSGDGR